MTMAVNDAADVVRSNSLKNWIEYWRCELCYRTEGSDNGLLVFLWNTCQQFRWHFDTGLAVPAIFIVT